MIIQPKKKSNPIIKGTYIQVIKIYLGGVRLIKCFSFLENVENVGKIKFFRILFFRILYIINHLVKETLCKNFDLYIELLDNDEFRKHLVRELNQDIDIPIINEKT